MATPQFATPEQLKIAEQADTGNASMYNATAGANPSMSIEAYKTANPQDYTVGLLNSLPKNSAPSNASNVNQFSNVNLPNNTPTSGNITEATAASQGLQKFIDTSIAQETANQQQVNELQKQREQVQKSISSLLTSNPTQEAKTKATAETGIVPAEYWASKQAILKEIESLSTGYNGLVLSRENEKTKIGANGIVSSDYGNIVANAIDRNYAIKLNALSATINTKVAVLQRMEGNFAEAQAFIKQAVEDSTADLKFKVDALTFIDDSKKDEIARLDTQYQNAWNKNFEMVKLQYQEEVANKKTIGDLILSNPQAGIAFTDSLEQAYTKIGINPNSPDYLKKIADINATNRQNIQGSKSAGFKDSKVEADVRSDVVDLIYNQGLKPEDAYKQLRTAYSSLEVSDDTLKSLLGINTTVTPTPVAITPSKVGTGNFLKTEIDARAKELSKFGGGIYIKNELIKEGYNKNDAYTAANAISNPIDQFTNVISKFLFKE